MLLDSQLHGGGNDLIDVADGLWAKPLGLILELQSIHPPLRQQLLVSIAMFCEPFPVHKRLDR